MFKKEPALHFLRHALPVADGTAAGPIWRIPFMHHPPYTAGPKHHNSRSLITTLVPLFQPAGVQAVFSGHEHNFQYSQWEGIHYFITGAGSKVTLAAPTRFAEAHTVAWAAAGHCVLVEVTRAQMTVRPLAALSPGQPLADLVLRDAAQQPVVTPIVLASPGGKAETENRP